MEKNYRIYVVSKVGKVCRKCGGKLIKDSKRRPVCKECGIYHFTLDGCYMNKKMINEESIVNTDKLFEVLDYIDEQDKKNQKLHKLLEKDGE